MAMPSTRLWHRFNVDYFQTSGLLLLVEIDWANRSPVKVPYCVQDFHSRTTYQDTAIIHRVNWKHQLSSHESRHLHITFTLCCWQRETRSSSMTFLVIIMWNESKPTQSNAFVFFFFYFISLTTCFFDFQIAIFPTTTAQMPRFWIFREMLHCTYMKTLKQQRFPI